MWSIEDSGHWLGIPLASGAAVRIRIKNFCGAARRMAGTLRVGILGAGWAGEAHIAAYSRLPGVEVAG
jgi:hypothetical protein